MSGAVSLAEVLRRLGLSPRGGSRTRIKPRIAELGLDTSAMRGQAWARGQRQPGGGRPARPLDEILVANSDHRDTNRLRERLIREGVFRARCEICGGTEWRGQPMPLRLDHINGDRRDNRLENLRLLCANCDAQTDTYCGRNIGRYDDR